MYAFHWLEQSMSFDFMKSLAPDKLLLDDEWHVQSTVFFRRPSLPADYMTASLWLAHLHGMGANEIWHWGRSEHGRRLVKDLVDSLTMQPVTLNAYFTGMMQINAYSQEVVALAQMPKTVKLLWSESSAIMSTDYLDTNLVAYQAASFLGQAVGYVTENQLAQSGVSSDTRLLIIPNAVHVQASTIEAIKKYIANHGQLVVIGDQSLTLSPDSTQKHQKLQFLENPSVLLCQPANPTILHKQLSQYLEDDQSIAPMIDGHPAYGVVCRSVEFQGQKLLFLMNLMNHAVAIDSIRHTPEKMQSLLNNNTQSTRSLNLTPMSFGLYLIQP
jgi:beta-galactosidase